MLSPILHPASGQWMLGKIEEHTAKPLSREELDALVSEVAALRAEKARLDHLETNLHDFRRTAPQVSMNPGPVRFSAWTPKHGRRHDYPTLRAALDDVLSQQQP